MRDVPSVLLPCGGVGRRLMVHGPYPARTGGRPASKTAASLERPSGLAPGLAWSEGLEPGVQEAEFVAFRVGQDVPALGAGLADVGGPGAEREQPLQLGVLVAVGGVNVEVQSELPGPRVAAGAEDEGGLRAAEAGAGRPDLDASVVLPAEFDVAEDLAPEYGEPVWVGGVDDQLTDAACHARQCRQTTREPTAGRVLEGDAPRDRGRPARQQRLDPRPLGIRQRHT